MHCHLLSLPANRKLVVTVIQINIDMLLFAGLCWHSDHTTRALHSISTINGFQKVQITKSTFHTHAIPHFNVLVMNDRTA